MTSDKCVLLQSQSMKITQNANFKMYPCCLYIDFSFSQSIDKSIRRVHGTYCMSLGSFYTPQERITVHLSEVKILFFSAAVCTIYCTMGLWKFCNYVIQEFACIPWRLVRVSQNIHIHCTQKKSKSSSIFVCSTICCNACTRSLI